jgi:hypothetical protein
LEPAKNPGRIWVIRDGYWFPDPSRQSFLSRFGNRYLRKQNTYVGTRYPPTAVLRATPLLEATYDSNLQTLRQKSRLHTWESVQKNVPVPAVPEPNSPDGVIPEYPSRGDFLAGSDLYRGGYLVWVAWESNWVLVSSQVMGFLTECIYLVQLTHDLCHDSHSVSIVT